MTLRTPQCEVFWTLMSNSKHSGVPEDSKSPTLGVLGFTATLDQSGVATFGDMGFAQWSRRIKSPFSPYHEITTLLSDSNKMNYKYEQGVRLRGTTDHGTTNHFELHNFLLDA